MLVREKYFYAQNMNFINFISFLYLVMLVSVVQAQECGRVTSSRELRSVPRIVGGLHPRRGEVPWHAGVYTKTTTSYMHICGGSIVSKNVILTGAHCFWTDIDKQLPAGYAVAAGKIYRPWNSTADTDVQKSDVKEIHLPPRYRGSALNFEDDIAVVILETPLKYSSNVQPICLNFDVSFDAKQLQPNNIGKVAGWGMGTDGKVSPILRVLEMSYLDTKSCIDESPYDFVSYITSDKICAKSQPNSPSLCKGDGGDGLAFSAVEQGTERYYLRGITSTSPYNPEGALCDSTLTTFTHIIKHEGFITPFLTVS